MSIPLSKADLTFFSQIGLTTGETAKALGWGRSTVQKWARSWGINFPNKPSAHRRFHQSYQILSETGCWIWTGADRGNGYGCLMIENKLTSAHRFSFETYKRKLRKGEMVCHQCDIPLCVNPDHLFAGSGADNAADMHSKGRANPSRGTDHHAAKLSDEEVRSIRASTERGVVLAKRYGVAPSTITKYRKGRRRCAGRVGV